MIESRARLGYSVDRRQRFRVCDPNQPLSLSPSLQDWLPEAHLARFVSDVVDGLDLSAVYAAYNRKDGRGLAAYHPVMMVRLLLYGYCLGVASSRQIERRTHEDLALAGLFLQALRLCEKGGLEKLLEEAALEQEARERAVAKKAAAEARLEERRKQEQERGKKLGGRRPQVPGPEQAKPEPKAQRNFTDSDSRIIKDGATKSLLQGFNAQAAVDDTAQVIVGCAITQEVDDKRQLAPPDRQKHEAATEGAGEAVQEPAKLAERPPGAEVSTDPAPAQASVAYAMRQEVAESGRAGGLPDAQGGGGTGVRADQGLKEVGVEWQIICLTHNLLKLFRAGVCPQEA